MITIFQEFLNKGASKGLKPSADRNGSISSTLKSITKNGPRRNYRFYTSHIKSTRLSGI